MLNVVINFGTNAATGQTGNSMALALYPPGCQAPQTVPTDPMPTCAYNSGVTLPTQNAPTRQIVVKNPVAGQWVAVCAALLPYPASEQPQEPPCRKK